MTSVGNPRAATRASASLPPPRPRLLAGCGAEGCAEALMLAQGFTVEQMVELVSAGLATAKAERVV